MNRHPSHRQSSQIRSQLPPSYPQEQSRRDRLLVAFRRAELAVYAATSAEDSARLVTAKKAALDALRAIADTLIAKEGRS